MNSDKFRYTFNGIEEIDGFGLNGAPLALQLPQKRTAG